MEKLLKEQILKDKEEKITLNQKNLFAISVDLIIYTKRV